MNPFYTDLGISIHVGGIKTCSKAVTQEVRQREEKLGRPVQNNTLKATSSQPNAQGQGLNRWRRVCNGLERIGMPAWYIYSVAPGSTPPSAYFTVKKDY
jgi:hypothetical protein